MFDSPHVYKRTAKPKKTLPKTAARPRPALGMKMEPAPPWSDEPLSLEPVSSAPPPPKPVTGMVLVAAPLEPVGAAVEDMVVGREVLPR